jgi:hypothetical protein
MARGMLEVLLANVHGIRDKDFLGNFSVCLVNFMVQFIFWMKCFHSINYLELLCLFVGNCLLLLSLV